MIAFDLLSADEHMETQIVDLTYPLHSGTPVPAGAAPVQVDVLETTQDPPTKGRRSLNVTRLAITAHSATHMDAPFHFFENGHTIDQVSLDRCMGPALVIRFRGLQPREPIEVQRLAGLREKLRDTHKVILNTGWASQWGNPGYFTDHPRLSGEEAQFLIDCGVHLIGVDMPSVDRSPFPAHMVFLGNGALIVENLTNLDALPGERIQLFVAPLKIAGRDGSPVRALAMAI